MDSVVHFSTRRHEFDLKRVISRVGKSDFLN